MLIFLIYETVFKQGSPLLIFHVILYFEMYFTEIAAKTFLNIFKETKSNVSFQLNYIFVLFCMIFLGLICDLITL